MPPGFGPPFGDDPEMFRDAPLFRELQRVMSSSSGPVNWELARQVGIAGAAESGEDRDPSEAETRSFEEAVRVAELHVARLRAQQQRRQLRHEAAHLLHLRRELFA